MSFNKYASNEESKNEIPQWIQDGKMKNLPSKYFRPKIPMCVANGAGIGCAMSTGLSWVKEKLI